jgi:hypothetical protein
MDFHLECVLHNYDEIAALTNVVRDKNNSGATPFVKVPENVIDGYLIAELELTEKRIPFIIRRPLPNGGSEY